MLALLAYEYVLTVKDEWELVWHRKMNSASWIFAVNRAILPIYIIDYVLTNNGKVSSHTSLILV